jgi:N-acetylgalactosamine-N,N'-diacetylbacillosaminyl-diphospho-undecaprenol 4-alpha-N-acetylgalactosaminyltransferase
MLLLLKHLDRGTFSPTLCLFSGSGALLGDVPDDVPVVDLGKRSRLDGPRLVARIRELLRRTRPAVVLSKLDYTNVVTAFANHLSRTNTPLVVVEEAVQSLEIPTQSHPRLRRALLRWGYERATSVVAPSPGVAADLTDNLGIRARTLEVIPNMVEVETVRQASLEGGAHPFKGSDLPLIVTMGRLVPPKGQSDLVRAVALLKGKRDCNLLILGEGEDRDRLGALAHALKISDRVVFAGFHLNPFSVLAQASVFVSPSHRESFGNAIIEAMAIGVPVVATRVPCGPEWIIDDGSTGLLAAPRDPADLASKIGRLLGDTELRSHLAAAGPEAARRYDAERVVARYEQLLERVARA